MKRLIQHILRRLGYRLERITPDDAYPLLRPLDRQGVEVLADEDFQASCRALGSTSLLDTPRLANLWCLSRLTDPAGAIMEIGTYKGGGALHLSHACPQREIIVCDPFSTESFDHLEPGKDRIFRKGMFADTSETAVRSLLAGRKARIIKGYFPASVEGMDLPRLSFIHLDVDVYRATKDSLRYLLAEDRLLDRSLIVLDDYQRRARGVDEAVAEIVQETPGTLAFPLFPGQALVIPSTWQK